MKDIPRIITGIIVTLIGLSVSIGPFVTDKAPKYILLYGIPILIIGIVILFNRRENEIEKVKSSR